MINCIITDSTAIILLDDGTVLQASINKEMLAAIRNASSDEELISIFKPEYVKERKECQENALLVQSVSKSSILTFKDDSFYLKDISPLSLPKELVEKIKEAEEKGDKDKIEAYKNFWMLMSLNPDAECRKNLFSFLQKWGMVISKSGLFVAYRNADIVDSKVGYDKNSVFTDHHSHTTHIKIGEIVRIPRSQCDSDSNVTCSRGLHLAHRHWIRKNYYGNIGLVCLCNPADVVAVPMRDMNYGKLRTCAYLPIDFSEFDIEGNVVPVYTETGFEPPVTTAVIYTGCISTEEVPEYTVPTEVAAMQSIEDILSKVKKQADKWLIER